MKYIIFLIVILFFIFHPWLSFDKTLSSGDWPYLYPENIKEFHFLTQPPFLWLDSYYQITAKIGVQILNLSWETTEKIFWFIPLIFLNLFSSWKFLKFIFKKLDIKYLNLFVSIGSFIYIANTYFLMLVGGGQMGVAVAYSIAPLAIYFLIKLVEHKNFELKNFIFSSFAGAVELMFDPRIFVVTLIAYLIYIIFSFYADRKVSLKKAGIIISALFIAFILNLFWILPNIFFYRQEYSLIVSEPLANFLSFATFPNALSLLHPNWPENIFGKVTFMRPEFLLIGIISYSSLFFIDLKEKNKNKLILFFSFLGLFGVFLAKGVNPPFGEIYQLLSTLPGSNIFRDPTKFYILIALSYSVLVPLGIYSIFNLLNKKNKLIGLVFFTGILVYFLFLLKPAFSGELSGTFSPHTVSSDYVKFKNFIISQNSSSNTLWIPSVQRFGISTQENNAIGLTDLFSQTDVASLSAIFDNTKTRNDLRDSEIKYIVVPDDLLKEIFIKDRKYDDKLHKKTISDLKKVPWLTLLSDKANQSEFGRLAVFKVDY